MGRRVAKTAPPAVGSRHLRWENFEPRIHRGPPTIEPVAGEPRVHIFVEPLGRRIGARFFGRKGMGALSPLEEVAIREILVDAEYALELSTGNPELYRDFYALCCSVADRVQLGKEAIPVAIRGALDSLAALIRRKSLLGRDAQIGLLGELVFLHRVAAEYGWEVAARSWFGPDSEEHDFVLLNRDVEVKTTTREERIHWITSLTQLLPKVDRPLVFVSVQLTLGGSGRHSFSLAEFVATAISKAALESPIAADSIRHQTTRRGWLDTDAPHYRQRYYLQNLVLKR